LTSVASAKEVAKEVAKAFERLSLPTAFCQLIRDEE